MIKIFNTILLIFVFIWVQGQSINELKARIEFDEAEKAFAAEHYEASIKHLDLAEKELGAWTPIVSYLKIISLHAITDMGNFANQHMQALYGEVVRYMTYLNELDNDEVPLEKYKVVYQIEKTMKSWKLDERQSLEFIKAKKEHDNKNYDIAISLWTALVNKGNSWAMRNLGIIYKLKNDEEKAKEWLLKALDNGNAVAADDLFYLDKSNRRSHFEKAASLGDPLGLYWMGYYVENYDKNMTTAMDYYQQSADLGSSYSLYTIGDKYYERKEYEKAIPYFRKAITKNSTMAMYKLGILYYDGSGIEKNTALGIEYLIKASQLGNSDAMRSIGWLYEGGRAGYAKDYIKAAEWYQKMIDIAEDDFGLVKLGDLYSLADNENPQKALEYYEKAAAEGYLKGIMESANIYYSGQGGVPKDFAKAAKYYEQYYDSKEKNESYIDNLIKIYSNGGHGLEKDKEKAKYWKEIRRK